MVQWVRLCAPNAAGDLGSILGYGTRFHMPQLEIPHATGKIEDYMPWLRPGTTKKINTYFLVFFAIHWPLQYCEVINLQLIKINEKK